jgi:hypothetical protein
MLRVHAVLQNAELLRAEIVLSGHTPLMLQRRACNAVQQLRSEMQIEERDQRAASAALVAGSPLLRNFDVMERARFVL